MRAFNVHFTRNRPWHRSSRYHFLPATRLNVADACLLASIVTEHVVAVPEHAPPHPENVNFDAALAVNVTSVELAE